jgi:hypothetical protein
LPSFLSTQFFLLNQFIYQYKKPYIIMRLLDENYSVAVDAELQSEIDETLLPYQWLPRHLWNIALGLRKYNNFNLEFSLTALLSAAATAIGNSHWVRIKGDWLTSPSFYMILVGRPGLGKTPPLEFAYRPIRNEDYENQKIFQRQLTQCADDDPKPILHRKLISDFTPEALMRAHNDNQRGICIFVDEIQGMFNSADRYSRGQLIEQLLTAYSGGALNITRCNTDIPLHIHHPCVNMVGTIQTKLIDNLFSKGLMDNGFIDRTILIYPRNQKVSKWTIESLTDKENCQKISYQWDVIMERLLTLPYEGESRILELSSEAVDEMSQWYNLEVDYINGVEDERFLLSRVAKAPLVVGRLALLIQLLKWACGEGVRDKIDVNSMRTALRLQEYFEYSYERLAAKVEADRQAKEASKQLDKLPNDEMLMCNLDDKFTASDAYTIGELQGISRRTVSNILNRMLENGRVIKTSRANYEKATKTA